METKDIFDSFKKYVFEYWLGFMSITPYFILIFTLSPLFGYDFFRFAFDFLGGLFAFSLVYFIIKYFKDKKSGQTPEFFFGLSKYIINRSLSVFWVGVALTIIATWLVPTFAPAENKLLLTFFVSWGNVGILVILAVIFQIGYYNIKKQSINKI